MLLNMAISNSENVESSRQFPDNFLFGTATGAYQVEGAWDEDNARSIWDDYFHSDKPKSYKYFLDLPKSEIENFEAQGIKPKLVDTYKGMGVYEVPAASIADEGFNFNGDIAADSYHKTESDVQLLKELGVKVYRFSINANRIISNIHDHIPNQVGIDYYNNLIDKLIENGITPMVTLHHYDMPNSLQILGGMTNSYCFQFFVNYARICFQSFGDRVKYWTTTSDLNLAVVGYCSEHFAPGIQESIFTGISVYIALHNFLLGHAKVYQMYNNEFRDTQKGEISITIDGNWYTPQDPNNPEHVKAASLAFMSSIGLIIYPLAYGKYPDEVIETVAENNKKEGYTIERIIQFTEEEKELIKGSFDFIVLNYYNSIKVRPYNEEELANEQNLKRKDRGYFMDFETTTLEEIQDGFLECLTRVNKLLNNPKIIIGENGFPEEEGVDDSAKKITYHNAILTTLLKALDNKINVFGYCVWSFIDTLEFTFGYSKKYGIYAVDFNDETRPRTKKNSFDFFEKLFKTKKLPKIEN